MRTTLNIIPLSAICDAFAQHEVLGGGESYEERADNFDESINNGPFTFGDTDLTLVDVKRFVKEWPEYDAAVYDVLSSEPDYVRGMDETIYIDLES